MEDENNLTPPMTSLLSLQKDFTNRLLAWFNGHERDLPWRRTYAPYHVWVSEIMLQQTQMDRVVNYFSKFIKRFPDIVSLARSGEDELLKMWEGLGYYSRARNLHKSAKILAKQGAVVPESYQQLLQLPGIGPYTASAIMAIAFNKVHHGLPWKAALIFRKKYSLSL